MHADDFRSLTVEELEVRVQELKKQLFTNRMHLHSNQLTNTNQIRSMRRDIARAETVRTEKLSQVKKAS